MHNDPLNLREPKKTKMPAWKRVALVAGFVILFAAMAPIGVIVGDYASKTSIDFRTDESTEVHKKLGEAYVHMGDNQPVSRAPLGSHIFVHNKYIKTETCHGFTSNVFWGIDNNVVVHYSMFTNWFRAGTYEANEVFTVPDYIPPGRYKVTKKTVSICNGKEHYTTNFELLIEFYRPVTK